MSNRRYPGSLFFAETPAGSTYFPFGRFSRGVVIPIGREDEFHAFQHRWSVRARISSAVAVLFFASMHGSLRLAGFLLVIGVLAAKILALPHLVDTLPQSDAAAPRMTYSERARGVPLGLVVASLIFFLVLIAICAPAIYRGLANGQPFSLHDAQVIGAPLLMVSLLVWILLLRRSD